MSSSQNVYLRAAVIVCGVLVEECGEQYAAVVAKELLSRPLGSDGGNGDGSRRLSGSVVDAQTERVEGWLCECEEAKRGGVCSCFYVRAVRAESRGSDIKTRLGIMGQICADGARQVYSCNVSRALRGDDECRVDANMSTVAGKSDTKPCLVEKVTGDICDSVSVSARTLANREKRARKKNRKLRKQAEAKLNEVDWRKTAKPNTVGYKGAFELCDEETRRKLAETRARRLISENEACVRKAQVESDRWNSTVKLQRKQEDLQMLKVGKQIEALRSSGVEAIQEDLEQRRLSQQLKIAQSRQKLELIAAQDLEGLKRRQASKVLRDTETNKVAVERAFGTLAGTGNIPSLVGGKVYTVNSGSISPNSSASEAEVRAIQKENLDLRKQVEELSAKLQKPDVPDYGEYDYSEGVTIDEDGHPIGDFGDYSGYIGRDNRFHFGESMMPYFD